MDASIKAKLDHQVELERLYSNNELMPRMRKVFEDFGAKDDLAALGIDEKLGMAVLIQMALRKRCNVTTLVGVVRKLMPTAQQAMDEVAKCVEAGLVQWNGEVFITNFTMPTAVQLELDRFQYPLPMVVRPKHLTKNTQTGYLASGATGSVVLKDNHTEDDVCLDHLNRVNAMKLTLNVDTATMVKNKWAHLDKPKEGESVFDYQKRRKAFDKYTQHAYHVMGVVCAEGNEFFITNRYDKRGRVYAQGHYINPQGTEWNKAVAEFAHQEITNG